MRLDYDENKGISLTCATILMLAGLYLLVKMLVFDAELDLLILLAAILILDAGFFFLAVWLIPDFSKPMNKSVIRWAIVVPAIGACAYLIFSKAHLFIGLLMLLPLVVLGVMHKREESDSSTIVERDLP